MIHRACHLTSVMLCVFWAVTSTPSALAAAPDAPKIEGNWKWSWTDQNGTEHKRTLKIRKEGDKLAGVIVRDDGSERPVKEIRLEGQTLSLSYTAERDGQTLEVKYSGKVSDKAIEGTAEVNGQSFPWTPTFEPAAAEEGWIDLIQGKTLAESGWKLRREADDKHKDGWSIQDGVLANKIPEKAHSIDIVHEKKFLDFDLHVEFRIPKGQNSGVYLRGIYEVQVEDTHGKPITKTICGAIYDQKEPSENAALPAGEWQTFDIQLASNKVTVVHNGKKVIDAFELKKATGSALDEIKHGDPGPLMLQGDHGNVDYRKIRIRPITAKK